jgi:hypothetical protein
MMRLENSKERLMKIGRKMGQSYLAQVFMLTVVVVSLAVGVGFAEEGGPGGPGGHHHHMSPAQKKVFEACMEKSGVKPPTKEQRQAGEEPTDAQKAAFKACHEEAMKSPAQ